MYTLTQAEVIPCELKDTNTMGQLWKERSVNFAIMKTTNGEKVLLSCSRVWINDKPKFGSWKPLTLEFFRNVNLQARRVEGCADFAFQAVFGHTGMYKRDYVTRDFLYPPQMSEWIKGISKKAMLDEELRQYATRFPLPLPDDDEPCKI